MIFIWILVIAIASVIWTLFSYRKEKNRREIEKAKEEMIKGRVIFHSSSVGAGESSS